MSKYTHEFQPMLSWDESALVCRRCDQFESSWLHNTRSRWSRFLDRLRGKK